MENLTFLTVMATIAFFAHIFYLITSLYLKYHKLKVRDRKDLKDEGLRLCHIDRKRYLMKEGYHLNHYTGVWGHPLYPGFELTDDELYRMGDDNKLMNLPTDSDWEKLLNKKL